MKKTNTLNTELKTVTIQVRKFILRVTQFCEIPLICTDFEWKLMEIVWQPNDPDELLPNALNHIIDLISTYLALSLTDLALLLGSTTKSFKFMSRLQVFLSRLSLCFLQRVSSAIKNNSNGIKLAITLSSG